MLDTQSQRCPKRFASPLADAAVLPNADRVGVVPQPCTSNSATKLKTIFSVRVSILFFG